MIVAIDGPAGAGKSTIARSVARKIGFRYLDTGALYRVVALAALERGIPPDDEAAVVDLTKSLDMEVDGTEARIGDRDVSKLIRGAEVTSAVSAVSAHPGVRAALVHRQREEAARGDVVIEGRDIGSRVVPEAAVKIFLTASIEERGRRRCRQLGLPESPEHLDEQIHLISERDEADSNRAVAPLVRAPDAILLDTTGMSFDEVVDRVAGEIERER